jgi:hypothetical protein
MEMAQARYAMGPARISQPLYSLKPYAASASVSVKSSPSSGAPETAVDQEDVFQPTSNCAIHFALQKQSSDGDDHTSNQPSKNTLKSRNMHHSSKSGEQAQLVPSGVCQSIMFHVSLFQRRALISLIRQLGNVSKS